MIRAIIAFLVPLFLIPAAIAQAAAPKPVDLKLGVLGRSYFERLAVPAGTPPWTWRLVSGTLPPGLGLERDGVISGTPTTLGDFPFSIEATDSSTPPHNVIFDAIIRVEPVLVIRWRSSPAVANGGIGGAVEVVNHVGRSVDLTVIVVAVNEFNKAFALGYQHFNMGPGAQPIDFGSTLPRGSYVVHADAVAEVTESNSIHRARLQTSVLSVP